MNFSGGHDLWVIPYGSPTYRKVNWWTQYLLSRYLAQERLRSGQYYLVGTEAFLPNKWTLLAAGLESDKANLEEIKRTWTQLGSPSCRIFLTQPESVQAALQLFEKEIQQRLVSLTPEIEPTVEQG